MNPELSRQQRADHIPPAGMDVTIDAVEQERVALAIRLQIPAVASLSCRYHLQPANDGRVRATIHLAAEVTRVCVISLDEFVTQVDESADLVFVPADLATDDDDPDAPDEIAFDGGIIDLGEVATEQLALALEPYPRKPCAELDPSADTTATTAFAALARLRRPN